MKLIKGKKYVITGYSSSENEEECKRYRIKLPQTVTYNGGNFFSLKDKDGGGSYFTWRFAIKPFNQSTIEIYPSRGQFAFRVISTNGKKPRHLYNTKQGCKKGIEALAKAMSNYKVIDLTK